MYKKLNSYSFLIKNRLILLSKVLVDIFLFIFIFKYQLNYSLFFLCINIISFWLISCYLIYRYNNIKSFRDNIKKSLNTLIIIVLFFIFNNFFEILKDPIILNLTSLFFFTSLIIQFLLSAFFFLIYSKKNLWIIITDENDLEKNINKDLNLFYNSRKQIIFKKSTLEKFNELDLKHIDGFIVNKEKELNKIDIRLKKEITNKGKLIVNWLGFYELTRERIPSNLIQNIDSFRRKENLLSYFQLKIKDLADFFVSLTLLLLSSPLFLLSACLIYLEDGGPILYSQIRTGKFLKTFRIYKLRTMNRNAEKNGAQWAEIQDERVTKVGKILRKTRIDELPQLFSVLKGDMSLIGPRPERPELEEKIIKKVKNYNLRNQLKPGISGWSQVNYPYGASIMDTKRKLSYDLYYIKNFSSLLDLIIFFKTIQIVFNAKGSNPIEN